MDLPVYALGYANRMPQAFFASDNVKSIAMKMIPGISQDELGFSLQRFGAVPDDQCSSRRLPHWRPIFIFGGMEHRLKSEGAFPGAR